MFTASKLFKEDAFNFLKYTLEKINKNKYKIEKYEGVYDYRILKDEEVMIEFSLDESFFYEIKMPLSDKDDLKVLEFFITIAQDSEKFYTEYFNTIYNEEEGEYETLNEDLFESVYTFRK